MAIIALNNFGGEIPAAPPALLPEHCAQYALHCDFTSNILEPLKAGNLIKTFPALPTKSIYTEDGIKFFTWSTDVRPFKGPIIDDAYSRVYYLNGSTATVAQWTTATINGGVPSTPYVVGVPTPSVDPVLSLVNRTTLADYPLAMFNFTAWYDLNGTKLGETALSVTNTVPLKQWTFTPPANPGDAAAVLTVQLELKSGVEELFTINTQAGAPFPATTSALPGGVEMTLSKVNDTTYTIQLSWGVTETRAYLYTVTNIWGEESAPSLPTLISPTYIQDVSVTATSPSFTGYVPFNGINIYRTFGSNSSYVRVATAASIPHTDSERTPVGVTNALVSTDWYPVATGLSGFGVATNGICWAFKNNMLYLSEPYRPHAWPYSQAFPTNIRGVCAGPQSIVVTTADACYVVVGSHSAAMSQIKLPIPQGGLSTRSMVAIDGGVAFASNDGIVMVTGSQATLAFSHKYFNRDDWRSRYSAIIANNTINLVYADGCLICATPSGTGFMLRTDEGRDTFTELDSEFAADGVFYLPILDTVYYTRNYSLYEWRGSSSYATLATWWSKDFIMPVPTNFAIGYIRTDAPAGLQFFADGAQYPTASPITVSVTGTGYFRIPGGQRGVRWSVKIVPEGKVHELYLASSMQELKGV